MDKEILKRRLENRYTELFQKTIEFIIEGDETRAKIYANEAYFVKKLLEALDKNSSSPLFLF